jgi:rare lipoprotein A (peptidoglycan hydrolase)
LAERLNPVMMNADEMNVRYGRIGTLRALGLAVLVAVSGAVAPRASRAEPTDFSSLQERAQRLGDQVTSLERDLEGLSARRAQLERDIAAASSAIGLMELERHDADLAYDSALNRYVQRAVEAYKDGSASQLAILLSSQSMSQLFTLAEAQLASAEQDSDALTTLTRAQAEVAANQDAIDEHKQRLLKAQVEIEGIASEIEQSLSTRRSTLARMTAEIDEIERQARMAAALAAHPGVALLRLLAPSGPSIGIPKGFVGTGVAFEGVASWYGPGFEGNHTASGDVFDPSLFTAASKELPLGTWLYVEHEGLGVVVLVNDRGPYVDDRIIDLSQAAAQAIGIGGLGWVRAEILLKI